MATKGVSDSRTVQEIVSAAEIVVFSGDYCPFCSKAISALKSAGYASKMIVINANSEQRQELFGLTHSTTVPNVWVKGKYVGGCYDGREAWMGIANLIENGQLKTMLA